MDKMAILRVSSEKGIWCKLSLHSTLTKKYLGLFCVGSIQPKPNDNSNNETERFWASKSHGWHCDLWIQCQIKMAIYHNVWAFLDQQSKNEKEKIFIYVIELFWTNKLTS